MTKEQYYDVQGLFNRIADLEWLSGLLKDGLEVKIMLNGAYDNLQRTLDAVLSEDDKDIIEGHIICIKSKIVEGIEGRLNALKKVFDNL